MAIKAKRIPWEYCECGCKSFTADVGGLHFSYYDDLHGGYWYAQSHNARFFGTRYDSVRKVNAQVRKALKARKIEVLGYLSELETP